MKVLKKFKIFLLLGFIMVVLTGCRVVFFESNAENLMKAPLSAEQSQIYQAVKEDIGSEFTHIYPESGEYRYSYIFYEDMEGEQRGLVFYKVEDNPSVRIAFIKKVGEKWEAMGSISSRADGVDQVEFANLGEEKENIDLIVGYTLFSGDKVLVVYELHADIATPVYEESYEDFKTIKDPARSSLSTSDRTYPKQLIVTSSVFGEEVNIIKLISKIGSEQDLAEETHVLKSHSLDYSRMLVEERLEGTVVYVDQLFGKGIRTDFPLEQSTIRPEKQDSTSEMGTEVFLVTEEGFYPLFSSWELTKRIFNFGSYSRDIDEDGIIEIPTANIEEPTQISGDDETRDETSIVSWMEVKMDRVLDNVLGYPFSGYFAADIYTVRNEVGDYNFIIPQDWLGKTSIRTNQVKGEGSYLHFYTLQTTENIEERLITIYAKEIESQDENAEIPGYYHLLTNEYFSYYVNINDEIKNTQIRQLFFTDVWGNLIAKIEN